MGSPEQMMQAQQMLQSQQGYKIPQESMQNPYQMPNISTQSYYQPMELPGITKQGIAGVPMNGPWSQHITRMALPGQDMPIPLQRGGNYQPEPDRKLVNRLWKSPRLNNAPKKKTSTQKSAQQTAADEAVQRLMNQG